MAASKPIAESLLDLSMPEPNTGCWLWIGAMTNDGYGTCRGRSAARVAYEVWRGPVPVQLEIDHLCRQRSCVNPEHLEAVTHRENVARGIYGGPTHRNSQKTHCPRGHAYAGANLVLERKRDGRYRRQCRICVNAAHRRRWAKRRCVEAEYGVEIRIIKAR